MKRCNWCGTLLTRGSDRCLYCGKLMDGVDILPPAVEFTTDPLTTVAIESVIESVMNTSDFEGFSGSDSGGGGASSDF